MDNSQSKLNRTEVIGTLIIVGFVSAVILAYVKSTVFHLAWPFSSFLFTPTDQFNDYLNQSRLAATLDPYYHAAGWEAGYFPFAFLCVYLFDHISEAQDMRLLVLLAGFSVYFFSYFYSQLREANRLQALRSMIMICLVSYPFLFLLDRANLEIFVFIFLSLFLLAYQKGKTGWAAFLLGAATAMKVIPGAFMLLFLIDRRFKPFFGAIAWTIVLSLISLASFKGGVKHNLNGILLGQEYYRNSYIINHAGVHYSSNLFSFLKILFVSMKNVWIPGPENWTRFFATYNIFIFLSLVSFSVLMLLKSFRHWEKICLIILAMLLAPHVTYDYKLIYLHIPLSLYLKDQQEDAEKDSFFISFLFALLLIPKHYYFLNFDPNIGFGSNFSISVILNPVLMCTLLAWIIYRGFERSKVK